MGSSGRSGWEQDWEVSLTQGKKRELSLPPSRWTSFRLGGERPQPNGNAHFLSVPDHKEVQKQLKLISQRPISQRRRPDGSCQKHVMTF